MSVINQVLNQLEQRGAHTAVEQTMVRAVPIARNTVRIKIALLVLAAALAVGALAWKWLAAHDIAAINSSESVTTLEESAVKPKTDTGLTASRLSFELNSVPLPSTLRPFDPSTGSGQVTSAGSGHAVWAGSGQALHAEKNVIATQPDSGEVKTAGEVMLPVRNGLPAAHPLVQADSVPVKQVSATQQADAEFRKAAALMQHGRIAEAVAGYEAALRIDAGHDQARQALVALMLEDRRGTEAERVLQDGLKSKPEHAGFAMLLARLQVERGAVDQAVATLEKSLPYADTQADYHAFFAALLQRQNRNDEAISHYQVALQLAPNNGVWQMGYGISLQAMHRNAEAKEAYKRALDTQTLNSDLQAFVRQKLKGL